MCRPYSYKNFKKIHKLIAKYDINAKEGDHGDSKDKMGADI